MKDLLEFTFEDYLGEIIESIDDLKIQGIAKRAIDVGFNKLSNKQRYVLKNGISDYIIEECSDCGTKINYDDMATIIENGNGMCLYCTHRLKKLEKE